MDRFRVWVRPLGSSCRVRVDGRKNADWLLGRLSRSFAFKSCEPVANEDLSSCCTFRIMYTSQMSRPTFDRLITSIPEVALMSDPA
jgi:hypothetical protein